MEGLVCIKCGSSLIDNWLESRKKRNYKICKQCVRIDNNDRYTKNKNKYLKTYKNKRVEIKAKVFEYYGGKCYICGDKDNLSLDHIDGNGRRHRREVLSTDSGSDFYKWVLKNKPDNIRLLCFNCNCATDTNKTKDIVFSHYGGKCKCGISNYKYLTIDHIDNSGAEHRRIIGTNIYKWLIKNNFPDDNYQILCYNCNYRKFFKVDNDI